MLRRDGEVKFFQVECLFYPDRGEDGWHPIGDSIIGAVAAEHRVLNPGVYDGKEKEPFQSYSASGACWQETGYHGTYDRDLGVQMLNFVSRYNPKYKFRLVEVRLSQARKQIMEAQG